jgi:branched-chain amino acid transport system substrate-binding protein
MADRQETPNDGMEGIRWMPPTNAGSATDIRFGPHDRKGYNRKGYKGGFVTIRELCGGELRFDGSRRPQRPSNRV